MSVPEELEAQRRAWAVVRAAYAEREPAPSHGRRLRLLVAVAVLAALVAAALSPPGRSVGGWIRDRVAGEETAEPALARLPSGGRLLVLSEQGPWIVKPDGSKRLLGNYDDASFSPNALFVVATQGRRVVALEPDGDVRWTVTRPTPVADARWAPSPGFHVAYREGTTLRVIGGDGEGDRLLAENVAPVAPAWRPGEGRTVLAYASTDGRVRVVGLDGEQLWAVDPGAAPEQLVWSDDAGLLLVVTSGRRHPVYAAGGRPPAARSKLRGSGRPRRGVRAGDAGHRLHGVRPGRAARARSSSPASCSSEATDGSKTSSSLRTGAGSSPAGPKPTSSCSSAFRA